MRISDWSSDVCSSDLACALIIDMLLRVGSRRCQASSERDMARSPLTKRNGNAPEDIIRAAERLFGEDGVSLVSLRQIAIAANQVNNFAVQYNFGDKDGMLKAIFQRDRTRVVEGKSVSVRLDLGSRDNIKKKKNQQKTKK